jgi:hypothetical protein
MKISIIIIAFIVCSSACSKSNNTDKLVKPNIEYNFTKNELVKLWEEALSIKGDLCGEYYYNLWTDPLFKECIFNNIKWKKIIFTNKSNLNPFLLEKIKSNKIVYNITSNNIYSLEGELSVYCLQFRNHIYWYELSNYYDKYNKCEAIASVDENELCKKYNGYKSIQIELQKILNNPNSLNILVKSFKDYLKDKSK